MSFLLLTCAVKGQAVSDSSRLITTFSGTLGITNNGFSIVPTFSLNAPAVLAFLSWKKNKFSIDPEIRLTTDARKGSILVWFRYHAINKKRFQLRTGIHPAMNLQLREIMENGVSSSITQMNRFIAWELAPSFKITPTWSAGIYYLQGNGLQKGIRTMHFVSLNTILPPIPLGKKLRFTLTPAVYYLNLDGDDGTFFTASAILKSSQWPFSLQAGMNQPFSTNIGGSKEFLWNVSFNYHMNRKHIIVKK